MRKKQTIYTADFVYVGKTHKEKYSVAVEDGIILESGKREVIKEQFPYAKEVRFRDAAIYPGFIDSHLHLNKIALTLTKINAEQIESFDALIKKINEDKYPISSVYNLDFNKISKSQWKTLFELKKPLFIQSTDEHSVFVNKALIKEKNIEIKETNGGEIVKEKGQFIGILKDNAIKNVEFLLHEVAGADALEKAENLLLQNGIVAATNFDYNLFDVLKSRESRVRIFQGIRCDKIDEAVENKLKTGSGNDYFRIGPVKCFLDGSLGSQTALMEEGIMKGLLTMPEEEFYRIVEKANKNNLQIAVHAIGSRAVHIALKAFKNSGITSMRNRIEHFQFLSEKDLPLMKETDFIASMQPVHFSDDKELLEKYIGKYKYAYPWKKVIQSGKVLSFGSDAPVASLSVIKGIETAVKRKEGGIKPDDAIIAYTEGSARANFYEKKGGRIVRGLNADFTVLNKKLSEEEDFDNIRVIATIVGGEMVWTA